HCSCGLPTALQWAAHQLGQRYDGQPLPCAFGLLLPQVIEVDTRRPAGQRAGGVGGGTAVAQQDHGGHGPRVGRSLGTARQRTSVSAVIVDSAVYRDGKRIVDDLPPSELGRVRKLATEPGDFVWVGLHEPTEDELATVEDEFGLHPLAVEDAFLAHQRPKLERYEHTLFLTLKSLWYVDAEDAVETGEINMFVGDDFVI